MNINWINITLQETSSKDNIKDVLSKENAVPPKENVLPSKEKDVPSRENALPPKENDVPRVVIEDYSISLDDTKIEKLDSVTQEPSAILTDSSVNVRCKSITALNDSPIVEDDEIKESSSTVVASATEKHSKKLVTTETQTDYINQIDGLPTPSGSEDRNDEDPMTFIVNKPLVYTPILPVQVLDSDSDNLVNYIRLQSPTTSQTDSSNKNGPIEETHNTSDMSRNGR